MGMKKSTLLSITAFLFLMVYCVDPERKKTDVANATATESRLKTASETYLKAWSDRDTVLIDAMALPNMVRNVNGKIVSNNPSGLTETLKYLNTAIPDFEVSAHEIAVLGNKSYINWTCTGTLTGMLGTIPPTGKKSTTEGFSILTFDNQGKLMNESAYYDLLGILQEWGFTVTPPVME